MKNEEIGRKKKNENSIMEKKNGSQRETGKVIWTQIKSERVELERTKERKKERKK